MDLSDMLYAPSSGYKTEKECLPGTRLTIIEEIHAWIHNISNLTCQLFWLRGLAGTGKSSIAHTVGKQLAEDGRLGSFFFFDASSKVERGPEHLFATIACDLADFDEHWSSALGQVIKDNKSLRTTDSVQRQFEELLLKPAKILKIVGPIVIIIDALDECGDALNRETLLSLLATKTSALPSNFKIIVTSRPDKDIVDAFKNRPHFHYKNMDTIDMKATDSDIYRFVEAQLSEKTTLLDEQWPDQTWCASLVNKAEGLFQWASTACLFVKEPMENPITQLEILLNSMSIDKLNGLYSQILQQSFPGKLKQKQLKFILGILLVAREPLNISVVSKLCLGVDPIVVTGILQHLGSLFRGVSEDLVAVQPLHTSVRDFFLNESQSHKFWVDTAAAHEALTIQLLTIMNALHFNMCGLPTSHLMNKEIEDLNERIDIAISAALSYACLFWTRHLEHITFKEGIFFELERFMTSKFLYWLEVLSLKRAMSVAVGSLERVAIWVKVRE
jgi:hypothetical protein